ncbi:MAG TPA: hypothetical protein VNL16_12990 [Chloroflexota bacterium]|nr:hypothetical protein [Chloroflexota bacterium]
MRPGSTVVAASACGLQSVGLEIDQEYFDLAAGAVLKLSTYTPTEVSRDGTLKGKAVYRRQDIALRGGKPVPINGHR